MNTLLPLSLSNLASALVIKDKELPVSQSEFAVTFFAVGEDEFPTVSHNLCIGSIVEEKSVPEACTGVVVLFICCAGGGTGPAGNGGLSSMCKRLL